MFRKSRSRRWLVCLLVVLAAGLVAVATAYAGGILAVVSPNTQSHCSGCEASWNIGWGGTAYPVTVTFHYGDGSEWTHQEYSQSSTMVHDTFYTCTGQTYYQDNHVVDPLGDKADAYASTFVAKGDYLLIRSRTYRRFRISMAQGYRTLGQM